MLWATKDDEGFLRLTGLYAGDVDAESGDGDESPDGEGGGARAWVSALLYGCTRSEHFDVASCCA